MQRVVHPNTCIGPTAFGRFSALCLGTIRRNGTSLVHLTDCTPYIGSTRSVWHAYSQQQLFVCSGAAVQRVVWWKSGPRKLVPFSDSLQCRIAQVVTPCNVVREKHATTLFLQIYQQRSCQQQQQQHYALTRFCLQL